MLIRLQKWLADAGVASRRAAEKMITDGRVAVNGKTVRVLGSKADTERDAVTLDGREVKHKTEHVYIMLHKPEGVVTTLNDPEGRPAVADYLDGVSARVYPVGRLDYDSSGLLLFTNDGDWAERIAHPRFGVKKKYAARIEGTPPPEKLRAFSQGVFIGGDAKGGAAKGDGRTAKGEMKIIKPADGGGLSLVHIVLTEGRNRQARRMCEAIGHPIRSLKRIEVGGLKLGGLEKGKWRYLTEEEVKRTKHVRNLTPSS